MNAGETMGPSVRFGEWDGSMRYGKYYRVDGLDFWSLDTGDSGEPERTLQGAKTPPRRRGGPKQYLVNSGAESREGRDSTQR